MPLDERLAEPERQRLLDLARPAAVLGAGGAPRSSPAPSRSTPRSRSSWRPRAPAARRGSWSCPAPRCRPRSPARARRSTRAGPRGRRAPRELPHPRPHRRPARAAARRARRPAVAGHGARAVRRRSSRSGSARRARRSRSCPRWCAGSCAPGPTSRGSARCSSAAAALEPADRAEAEALGATHRGDLRAHRVVRRRRVRRPCRSRAREVRLGDEQRIELHGPTVMQGYRHDGAATGAAFDVRGWLRTGDAGTIDDDGRLQVHRAARRGHPHGGGDRVAGRGRAGDRVAPQGVRGGRRRPAASGMGPAGRRLRRASHDRRPSLARGAARSRERDDRPPQDPPRAGAASRELPRTPGGKVRRGALPER